MIRRILPVLFFVSIFVFSPFQPANSATPEYILPARAGTELYVSQGNNDYEHSHSSTQAYAFDFTSKREPRFIVTAARGGIVRKINNSSSTHCGDRSCASYANYVLIDHGDGTSGLYLHLEKGSVLVSVGDQVSQGQELARVGLSGWTTGLHLHFQVEVAPVGWFSKSLPIKFNGSEVLEQSRSTDGIPKQGQTFTVSGKKGDILPSAAATTRPSPPTPSPTVKPSRGAPTPTPVPVPTPTKSVPRKSAPSIKPTPSKPAAQTASITIVRLWTQNKNGVDSSSFACLGSTNRVIKYRVSLNTSAKVTAHVSLIESWGGQPLNQDYTFAKGPVEFYTPSDSPQGKAGTQSYTLIIDYQGKRVTAKGELTTTC